MNSLLLHPQEPRFLVPAVTDLPTAPRTQELLARSKLSRVDKANLTAALGHYLHASIGNTSILHITPE